MWKFVSTAAFAASVLAATAHADVVYSNLAVPGNLVVVTQDSWDDATIVGGGTVSGFSFWASNNQTPGPRSVTTVVSLYLFSQATGLPDGTLLGSFSLISPPLAPGTQGFVSRSDLAPLAIVVPANARLGVRFDFESNAGALMFGVPTIGTSQDILWLDTPPSPFTSPAIDNIGFAIEVVPSPGTSIAIAMLGVAITRRRRYATGQVASTL